MVCALDDHLGLGLGPDGLLALSRRVENDAVGAPTGGMDQLASLRGEAGHVLFCDMRDLTAESVPFDPAASGLAVLVVDTKAPHRHADGEYAARRTGCEEAARRLGVPALRDVAEADLDDALARLDDDELERYVRHVVTEDARVLGGRRGAARRSGRGARSAAHRLARLDARRLPDHRARGRHGRRGAARSRRRSAPG